MIKHSLIEKGKTGHALLSSARFPNVLIPAKVVIKDVKFDENNPQYLVKIIMFYDTTYFLKTYFMNMPFKTKFGNRAKALEFPADFKPTLPEHIVEYMDKKDQKYWVVVDSVSCMRYKRDMIRMYSRIQDYLIERDFNSIKEKCITPLYEGKYKMSTKMEFFGRLKKMIVDLVAKTDKDWINYIDRF